MRAREYPRTVNAVAQAMHHASALRPLPLLVLRLPELERIAWRQGRRAAREIERTAARAFYAAARRSLRTTDMPGHDCDSDVFVAAMLAPSREKEIALPSDYRAVLQRIAREMSKATNLIVETGWAMVGSGIAESTLTREIASALERGQRERERFDFFVTLGHELRTPLASIHGYLETLLEKDYDARMSRRFLENAHREAMRLGRLVDGMFTFSCLGASADGPGCEQCDLQVAVRSARDAVLPIAASRGVRIEVSNVVSNTVTMEGDACIQALINILDNAIKHGREQGTVIISSNSGDGYVRIIVDDDGLGVPELERNAIFGLRVRGSSAQKTGTGIGLAIVRMFVERAGGEIRVADSPLGGARFEMSLPARAESLTLAS